MQKKKNDLELELSPKQIEFINNATHRWNGKIGATQCGKTFIDIAYVIANRIMERKGKIGLNLILGVTKETIERNVLEPMRDFWGSNLVGDINSRNTVNLFGQKVYCLGAEKVNQVSKLRGSKVKYCYCDELVDLNQEVFALLKSRLSLPYSTCDFTGNPSYPTHFLKEFIDSDIDIYCQNWTIYDNPFLDQNYVKELEKEYKGTVYFQRYILGKWQIAEGLVYSIFNKELHVVKNEKRNYEKYYVSNDYGVQHTNVFLIFGLEKNVWYLIDEYGHTGQDINNQQKTVEEYYNDLIKFIAGRPITKFYLDNAPIASNFNLYLKRKHELYYQLADNDVLAGIQDVVTALNNGILKINENCKNTIKQFGLYLWDASKSIDIPIKANDDWLDAVRYFVRSARISIHKRQRGTY